MSGATRGLGCMLAAIAALSCAGCFGSDDGGDGADGHAPSSPVDAKLATIDLMQSASGTVDYCTDPSKARLEAVSRFNDRYARQGLRVHLQGLPTDSAKQHRWFIEHPFSCDVYDSDVIWIANLAARGRIYNMKPYLDYAIRNGRGFIDSTLDTALFDGDYWGVPHATNAGFLFYDKAVVRSPRDIATWRSVYERARAGGMIYGGSPPESLTVNFLEIAFAAGGRVLSRDGARSVIDSPENLEALRFMMDGVRDRLAFPTDSDDTTHEFEGPPALMRDWPVAFDQLVSDGRGGSFGVTALPIFDGAGVAGVLGGVDLVISDRSDTPGGALTFIDYVTRPEQQIRALAQYSEPAVLVNAYKAAEVRRRVPFAAALLRAVRQGRPRPVSPAYAKISAAISSNVGRALRHPDEVSPEDALADADRQIDDAIADAEGG